MVHQQNQQPRNWRHNWGYFFGGHPMRVLYTILGLSILVLAVMAVIDPQRVKLAIEDMLSSLWYAFSPLIQALLALAIAGCGLVLIYRWIFRRRH